MERSEIIIAVCFVSLLLLLLVGFLFFVLLWQRKKSNNYIQEREVMKTVFNDQLLQSRLEMQEQTFNAISQEIHDNVGQILSLAKVQLNIIEHNGTFDKTLLTDVKENVSKAMTDLRDIATSLNSDRVQLSSLTEMIIHELNHISRSGLMSTNFEVLGDEHTIQNQKKLILFRVIQEALQNIFKHSQASSINVKCNYQADHLQIQVADNGKGFDKDIVSRKDGLGLQNIINRAALIGGKAQIESVINEGTSVIITTPYV
jgi:two-component system NarL family sensor kinase